jgi:hypothetical protein
MHGLQWDYSFPRSPQLPDSNTDVSFTDMKLTDFYETQCQHHVVANIPALVRVTKVALTW